MHSIPLHPICSFLDGRVDCFHFGGIINKASSNTLFMSVDEHIHSLLLEMYPQIEMLGHDVDI